MTPAWPVTTSLKLPRADRLAIMNATSTPHTAALALLKLTPADNPPNAYRCLGLALRESDLPTIQAALQRAVARLNAAKPSADPAAWDQAARWVKAAHRTLGDPQRKAELDRQLAAAAEASAVRAEMPVGTAVVAERVSLRFFAGPVPPLAGLPPAADSPPSPAEADIPAAVPTPPVPVLTGATADDQAEPVPAVPAADFVPVRRLRRRKRQSPWIAASYVVVVAACIGGLTGLMVFLSRNPLVLTSTDQPVDQGAPSAAVPAEPLDSSVPPVDPSRWADDPDQPASGRAMTGEGGQLAPTPALIGGSNVMAGSRSLDDEDDVGDNEDADLDDDLLDDDALDDDVWDDDGSDNRSAAAGDRMEGDEAQLQRLDAGDVAREASCQAIAAAQWDQMIPVAEAALQAAADDRQRQQAADLLLLAQLAVSYHQAVQQGLQAADGGQAIQVTDQLSVVIEEVTEETVAVKYNGRDRQYPRQSLPLVIAHRLAEQVLPAEQPRTRVAAETYQAVAPVTTKQYRYLAMDHLDEMDIDDPELDPRAVSRAILQAFPR